MTRFLTSNPQGGYSFLAAIEPYSAGVIAEPGYEIIHVTLQNTMPWLDGLIAAKSWLEARGLPIQALCAAALRCSEPHSFDGFATFNQEYRRLLDGWGVLVDGINPVARTNVSPVVDAPADTQLFGFSFCQPSELRERTYVVAGGGELPHRDLCREHIVRVGETTEDALREKAECVADIMRVRLERMKADESLLSVVNVYTCHPVRSLLEEVLIPQIPAAAHIGIRWNLTRPPVREIEFEMDLRGVRQELTVDFATL